MIYNYIGEDIIWRALGTNPYEKNPRQDSFSMRYKSLGELSLDVNFILNHIEADKIEEIVMQENNKNAVSRIRVRNVFGNINEIRFIQSPED